MKRVTVLHEQFKRDVSRAQAKGQSLDGLKEAMRFLEEKKTLPLSFCDGPLVGGHGDCTCRIGPGLHIIYKVDVELGWVIFQRLGGEEIFG